MSSSQATCLLCLSIKKKTINFHTQNGRELNIISILSTHFWFQLDEIKGLSQNICCECWQKTEAFHEFYQSIRFAHKKFETVFVKIENDLDNEDEAVIFQPVQVIHNNDNSITEFFKIENIEEDESSTSVCEIQHTNSIDTETRAFDALAIKTQKKYTSTYKKFLAWKVEQNIDEDCFSEAVLLEYFYYMQSKNKPSSLWAQYSMLRTTIQRNNNIDISYPEVTSLLKKSAVGFRSQKSTPFQPDQIQRFFSEAKDSDFLALKIIMIFGMHGVSSTAGLAKIEEKDVTEQGSVCVVKYTEDRTNEIRTITIENDYAKRVQKYKKLRPSKVTHNRFFLTYHKGKCTAQPIGINKFRNAPKAIATFLNVENAESYTLQSFRRESGTNKRKIGGPDAEQINSERSNEATVTSTITSSADTSTVATSSTTANKICEEAKSFDLLPEKSQVKYLRTYDNFMAWKDDEEIEKDCFTEAVMLEYFSHLKTKYKPTSLWAHYSMLRTTILKNYNVDISYPSMKSFLKTSSFAYLPRKSTVFQPDEIQRFLSEADDREYLAVKVIMIFRLYGGTSADELSRVEVKDVTQQGSVFVIKILDTKTNVYSSFTVENEYAAYVQKYKQLRPATVTHDRFFLNYNKAKCTAQPIGKHKFINAPKDIANFLKLKDVENYTLHSLRKKAFKRMSAVLDSYVDESSPKKRKTVDLKSEQIKVEAITEVEDSSSDVVESENQFCEDFNATAWDLLPGKSREKYVRAYYNLMAWKTEQEIDKECFSEEVMLQYFNYLKVTYKPTSLWAEYSKLKATIKKNDNIDISYPSLRELLRTTASGYLPQKCNVFQPDQISRFLYEADDQEFLAVKVIMIFGMYGATSIGELRKVEVDDVIEQGSVFVIKIPDTKTNGFRSFTVENEYATFVQKYKNLRPKNIEHNRFFIQYENGKCTTQVIGQNKFSIAPKTIANFLNLEDVDNYGGHSYRKTSKRILADGSAGMKRHGGCSSSSAVDSYIEEEPIDRKIDEQISQINLKRPTKQNTCTITSSMDTNASIYHVQTHQAQPYYVTPYGISTGNLRDNVHVQPHSVQLPPLLPFSTSSVNIREDDVYVQPAEEIRFNSSHS